MKLSKKTITFVFVLQMLFILLVFAYVNLVSQLFSYAGMSLEFSTHKLIISMMMLLFSSCLIKIEENRVSSVGKLIIIIFFLIPICIFWVCSGRESYMQYVAFFSYLVICIFSYSGSSKILKITRIKYANFYVLVISFVLIIGLIVPLVIKGGLSHFSLGIQDVYVRREIVHGGMLSRAGGYLLTWCTKVIVPALIVIAFVKKKYFYCLALMFLQFFIFGITGHKEQIFYPLIVIGLAFMFIQKKNITLWTAYGVMGLFLFVTLLGMFVPFFEVKLLSTALISRTFFSVALNHIDYFDFFQINEFVYWSNSFMSFLIEYPYSKPVPELIGYGRWGLDKEAYANAGFIGSGYMHFGVAGVFIYSMIVGLLFKFFDLVIKENSKPYKGPICILAILQLINGDLTTSILTNGIFLSVLIVLLVRYE